MSVRNTVRALPALMRVGFAEAVAYRAEMFVWILATSMPLVMMALWTAVAAEAPVGRFGQPQFVYYFLVTFIVRQLTSVWVAWQINFEVRTGQLAMRLLRPVSTLWHYAVEQLASLPQRLIVALPVAVVLLVVTGRQMLPKDWLIAFVFFPLSVVGAWFLALMINFILGALSLFMEQTVKLIEVWLAAYFVFSGYLIPMELCPAWFRHLADAMPFRYALGYSVDLMTGAFDRWGALVMLGRQWAFVAGLGAVAWALWKRGVRRFAAYGG